MDKKWWMDALVNPDSFKKPMPDIEKAKNPLSPLYVRVRDLNDGTPYGDLNDAPPKPAVEIGLRFEF